MRKSVVLLTVLALTLSVSAGIAAPLAQVPAGEEYTVKPGDQLHKIAEELLGVASEYHLIVNATNLKTEEDSSYSVITNPDVIEVGQKLWIPAKEEATPEPTAAPTEEPTPEPTAGPTEEPTPEPTMAPTEEPTPEPTVAPTEEPTPAPTAQPTIAVTKTEIVHYVPDVPKTSEDGSCWTSSISTPTGWRCTVDNSIYDPCLIGTDGKTVVCGLTGGDQEPFALNLTEPLPTPDASAGAEAMPYRLDLANGATCNFATGTLIPVGDDVIQYYCSDEYGILSDIQEGTVWKVKEVKVGSVGDDGKASVTDSRSMDVAKVWYGPEQEPAKASADTTPEAKPTAAATATTAAKAPPAALVLAFAGTYKAELPAASSPGRDMTLTLNEDGTIEWTTDYMNDEPAIVQEGTWESGSGGITVSVTNKKGEKPYDEPDVITFKLVGDELTAVEYDKSMWGSEGLTLKKQ